MYIELSLFSSNGFLMMNYGWYSDMNPLCFKNNYLQAFFATLIPTLNFHTAKTWPLQPRLHVYVGLFCNKLVNSTLLMYLCNQDDLITETRAWPPNKNSLITGNLGGGGLLKCEVEEQPFLSRESTFAHVLVHKWEKSQQILKICKDRTGNGNLY